MYLKDPFVTGPAPEPTAEQKQRDALDKEWQAAGSVAKKPPADVTPRTADEIEALSEREFSQEWKRLGVNS